MEKLNIVIKGCKILTPEYKILNGSSIGIKGNRIAVIAPFEEIEKKYEIETILDGYNKLAMPGLVDGHVHTCQEFLRGGTCDEYPMIWTRFLIPFESNLGESDVYASSRLCALEMLKNGTTGFAESGGPLIHAAVKGYVESGMRARLAYSIMDQGREIPDCMKSDKDSLIKMTEDLYHEANGAGDGRIGIYFGIRQIMTCSPDLMRMTAEKARELNTGVHMHLEEHKDEVKFCLQYYKMRPVDLIESLGLLGDNLITAHSVVMTDSEIRRVAQNHVNVVHNPRSNLSNHGMPRVSTLLEWGANIGLGTDGTSGNGMDIFEEMKILRQGEKFAYGLSLFDPKCMTVEKLLEFATKGGAHAIGTWKEAGSIEVGNLADIITINLDQPHISPSLNLVATLVDHVNGNDVADSIIDGKLVMKDREVLTMDEKEIMREAQIHSDKIKVKAGF